MNKELETLEVLSSDLKQIPSRIFNAIKVIFEKYGIEALGVWNSSDEWTCAKYDDKDMSILGNLKPKFDGMVGWSTEYLSYSSGPIVALKWEKGNDNNLLMVMDDDDAQQVEEVSISEYSDYGVSLVELIDTVINSIKFNLENNVPIELWGLNHYPDVDPYSYEYISGDEEDDEEDE